jgi:uncharacterized protein (DUF2141 family)
MSKPASLLSRSVVLSLALCACAAGEAGADPAPTPAAPVAAGTAQLVIEMSGFRNDKGVAAVALFTSSAGFPDKADKAARRMEVAIKGGRARAVVRGLPAGTYAVAVLHDEDRNHKMKTGLMGIPKEGYGASRDARGRFGPPKFDDARLGLRAGQAGRTAIKMTYP